MKKNYDVFAWSQGDVLGIDPQVAVHKLFTNSDHSLVCQKRRKFALERLKVIKEEVAELIKVNVIREAHYPNWFTNVVVAPNKGRSGEYVELSNVPAVLCRATPLFFCVNSTSCHAGPDPFT